MNNTLHPTQAADRHHQWMLRALELAKQGEGYVEPNPMVGCVLVAAEQVIGEGYHARFGGPHAERQALSNAVERGNQSRISGCTAYVTLEPCCHYGKTPPCTEALLAAGVGQVVVGMLDPFAEVAGRGIQQLREQGVEVVVDVAAEQARRLNLPYLKRLRTGQPWIIAKWAMSLDGKIASHTQHSQWISGTESRAVVQQIRGRVDAILVGSNTAVVDNPLLTARTAESPPRRALRVVTDSHLRLPLDSQLVQTARQTPVLIWAGPGQQGQDARTADKANRLRAAGCEVVICDEEIANARLDRLLDYLVQQYQATNLLVEGGGTLLGSLWDMHKIDQCEVFIAPKIIGGAAAPSPIGGRGLPRVDMAENASDVQVDRHGQDLHIHCLMNSM